MGNVVVTEFISLDGVMADPHEWSFPYWNEEIATIKQDELNASDALLLGRVTYEGFAASWPGRTDDTGFADKFNTMPKYVVSTTLESVDWEGSVLIRDNIADEIRNVKQRTQNDIAVHGSGMLADYLRRNNLIDIYRLLVYPLVLGAGKRLFDETSNAKLELVESRPTSTGVVLMTYAPASA
jgi:dihydrofolate reductase